MASKGNKSKHDFHRKSHFFLHDGHMNLYISSYHAWPVPIYLLIGPKFEFLLYIITLFFLLGCQRSQEVLAVKGIEVGGNARCMRRGATAPAESSRACKGVTGIHIREGQHVGGSK